MDLRPRVGLWTVLMVYSLCYSNGVLDSAADDQTGISADDPTAISMKEQHANSKTDDLNSILDERTTDHSQKPSEISSDNATFSPKPANISTENSTDSPKLTEPSFGNSTFSPKLTEFASDNSTLSPKSTDILSTTVSDISTAKTTGSADTYSTTTIFNNGSLPLTSKQGGDSALITLESYLPEIDLLCPGINVCGRTRDDDSTVATTAINNCCSNCSCESSCIERQNCCYDNISTDGQQKMFDCLMPVVGDYDIAMPSYRFVVAPPMDGCKTADDITIEKIRSFNENVSPWGDFYPVYSKSFDLNFKNEKIASCHGTRDIEKWKPMAINRGIDDGGQGMTHFLRTFNSSDVFIVFEPPRPEIIHRDYTCIQASVGTCPINSINTFKVPSYFQTDRKGIVAACEQGPRALYWLNPTFAFKNVYCAICNYLIISENNDSVHCRYNGIEGRQYRYSLVTLLNEDFIDTVNIRVAEMRDKPSELECYRPESHVNYLQCVQLQCPMFQIRLADIQCGYESAVLLIDGIYVQLNLTTTQTIDISFINNLTEASLYSMFQRFSPWKRCWEISRIGLRIETNKTEFVVHVGCKAEQFELKNVNRGLKKRLSKQWVVPFTNRIQFKQQLDKHGDTIYLTEYVSDFKNRIFSPRWTTYTNRSSAQFENVLWKQLYWIHSRVRYILTINKLFFCHQIELRYSEYEIRFNILYFKNMSRHLYPGEYSLFHDELGSQRVLVCLDNSGYIKAGSGTRAMYSRFLVMVVACLEMLATLAHRILVE